MSKKREMISIREFARRKEISYAVAYRAVKRGRVTSEKVGKGIKIPWPLADREFDAKRDNSKIRKKDAKRLGVDIRKPGYKHKKTAANGKVDNEEKIDLWDERARKEKWLAKIRELDYLERSSELVSAKIVEDAAFEAARKLRDAFVNIPNRIASIVAAENEAARCHQILKDEIETVLRKLANYESD